MFLILLLNDLTIVDRISSTKDMVFNYGVDKEIIKEIYKIDFEHVYENTNEETK